MKPLSGKHLKDSITVVLIISVLLICSLIYLDSFVYWGDDFAAYLNEGIAIAEGRFDEQTVLNKFMHPSELTAECKDKLVYVWFYPLILSFIYRIVGYDTADFASIIYYKLPTVIFLIICSVILYLMIKKRAGRMFAFPAALLFGLSAEFFTFYDTLYNDIVFMALTLVALYLARLRGETQSGNKKASLAVLLGLVLFAVYETRLSGMLVLAAAASIQLSYIIADKKTSRKALAAELVPWIIGVGLIVLFENLIFAPATGGSSDLGKGSASMFVYNLTAYIRALHGWFTAMWNTSLFSVLYSLAARLNINSAAIVLAASFCAWLSLISVVLGMLVSIRKRDVIYSGFSLVILIGAAVLPYYQGLRYIYCILPLLLVLQADFVSFAAERIKNRRIPKPLSVLILAGVMLCMTFSEFSFLHRHELLDTVENSVVLSRDDDIYLQNAFSNQAKEAYRFVIDNTEEDAVIAFAKPRLLYLNTGRIAFSNGENGHHLSEADYYIGFTGLAPDRELKSSAEKIFENNQLFIYRLN